MSRRQGNSGRKVNDTFALSEVQLKDVSKVTEGKSPMPDVPKKVKIVAPDPVENYLDKLYGMSSLANKDKKPSKGRFSQSVKKAINHKELSPMPLPVETSQIRPGIRKLSKDD